MCFPVSKVNKQVQQKKSPNINFSCSIESMLPAHFVERIANVTYNNIIV